MHGSQILLSGIIAIIIYKTVRSYLANKISLLFTLFWLGLWVTVIVALFLPGWLDIIAKPLGIGRGVDFAIYFSIIVLFYLVYRIYSHLMRIESKLTQIVRKEAIKKAKK